MRVALLILSGWFVAGCAVSQQRVALVAPAAGLMNDQHDSERDQSLPPAATGQNGDVTTATSFAGAIAQANGELAPAEGTDPNESSTNGQPQRVPVPVVSPWSLVTTVGSGLASNINFDRQNIGAYGAVLATGLRFDGDDVAFSYEAAGHSYTNTNRWNRVSHFIAASFEQDLFDKWELETVGNVGFNGSSEDRDIVDQDFEISPQLSYEFTPERRLRLFTAHRLKRYDNAPDTNAFKNYIGAEFREIVRPRQHVEIGARFETNDEHIDRGDYRRWTYWVEHAVPLTRQDALVMQLRYRLKRYTHRFVEVEDEDVLRVDHRWLPTMTWIRTLQPNLDLRFEYSYETNYSNNPEREYGAHILWTSMSLRWCGGCWPFSR